MRFIVSLEVPSEGIQAFVDDWRDRRPKDVKILLRPHISAETINGAQLLTVVEAKKLSPITDYCRSLEEQGVKVQLISIYDDKSTSRELKKFQSTKRRAERHNRKAKTRKLKGLGSTKNLTVLPLIDWRTNQEGLMVETGVSYLVRTDGNTILFDTGLNSREEDPSPLLRNMEKLGVTLNEIDTIFITHNHEDHVGGVKWAENKTFSVTGRQDPLSGVKVYVPTMMTYPDLEPCMPVTPWLLGRASHRLALLLTAYTSWDSSRSRASLSTLKGKALYS